MDPDPVPDMEELSIFLFAVADEERHPPTPPPPPPDVPGLDAGPNLRQA